MQHDILWEQLTAREHLELFCAFKNLPEEQVDAEVMSRLKDVALEEHGDKVAGNFSGGMRRRLSVAIGALSTCSCFVLSLICVLRCSACWQPWHRVSG